MNPSHHRIDIQGLRALAIVLVVMYHVDLLGGGFIGVDVFFVISGFVITQKLVRGARTSGRVSLSQFYAGRVHRLLPALTALLVVTTLAAAVATPVTSYAVTARTAGAATLFVANMALIPNIGGYFAPSAEGNPLLHTWSLSVEEQFYLVFPLALAAALSVGRRTGRSTAVVVGLLFVGSSASLWLAGVLASGRPSIFGFYSLPRQIAFYAAPARGWEFGVGALLAFSPQPRRMTLPLLIAGSWAALALLVGCAVFYSGAQAAPGLAAVGPVLATLILLASGAQPGSVGTSLLSNRPASRLGDLSYGWYLWHWPLIVFAGNLSLDPNSRSRTAKAAAAALSLGLAWVSFRRIEDPIRRLKDVPIKRTAALGVACVGTAAASGLGLVIVDRATHSLGRIGEVHSALAPHLDVLDQCSLGDPLGSPQGSKCSYGTGRGGNVVLVGDSNAGQLSEAFVAAAGRAGMSATIATTSGCPFIDTYLFHDGLETRDCRAFYVGTLAQLKRVKPDVVMIASALDVYSAAKGYEMARTNGGRRFARTNARQSLMTSGLVSTVSELARSGIHVVVMDPIPKFSNWSLFRCTAIRIAIDSCATSERLVHLEAAREPAVAAGRTVLRLSEVGRVEVLDLASRLCPDGVCSARRNGRWLWSDGRHLTPLASGLIAEDLTAVLARRPQTLRQAASSAR